MPALAQPHRLSARVVPKGGAPAAMARPRDVFEGPRGRLLTVASDAVMFWVAASIALHLPLGAPSSGSITLLLAAMPAAAMTRLAMRGMYTDRPTRMAMLDQARTIASSTGFAAMGALAVAALLGLGDQASRTLVAAWALGTVLVTGLRVALTLARRRARRRGLSGSRVLIVGAGVIGAQLERRLLAAPELGLVPVGFLDADPAPAAVTGRHGRVLGTPDQLAAAVAATAADHVVVAFSSAPDSTVQPLLRRCEALGLEVSVIPRLFESVNDRQWVEHIGGMPLVGLGRVDPKSWPFEVKHLADRVVAAVLVAALAPLLLLCALAVRVSSPGAVLFRQRRVGRDGRSFAILKFRSMREAPKAGFVPVTGAAPGGVEGDDRRTRVGTFLRRTSLDELPQLINVARGDMSLIGPRPERPEFVELFGRDVRRYGERHRVKSGMTGWAQVHGLRGQTSLSERVEWDNWYISNWSLWLDLKILLMTPLAVLRAPEEGAPPPREPQVERRTARLQAGRIAA